MNIHKCCRNICLMNEMNYVCIPESYNPLCLSTKRCIFFLYLCLSTKRCIYFEDYNILKFWTIPRAKVSLAFLSALT
uniref:Putative ovule protein n=1 Tax=Solanum chacoense TaxID=4108 RepID=A0A0V0HC55_SOLCH